MKALLAGLLLLVACKDDIEMFPVNPGGGGGGTGGTGFVDAGMPDGDGDAGNTIAARVCLLNDARDPTSCANTGAENLMVTLGTFTATTAADGSFSIMRPSGSNLVWIVTGTAIQPSAMSFGTLTLIPAVEVGLYGQMVSAANVTPIAGDGAIIAQVKRGTTPVTGLVATTVPDADTAAFYDGNTPENWDPNVSGGLGMVWVPGVPTASAGSAQLLLAEGTTVHTIQGIPVFDSTVTFVFAAIP